MRLSRRIIALLLRTSSRADVQNIADSFYNIVTDGGIASLVDAQTITWDVSNGWNASVTLGGNRNLEIANPVPGSVYNIVVRQDATGGRSLNLPSNSKVFGGGEGSIILTSTANAIDMLSAYYDGYYYYWTYGLNFN